MKFNICVAIPVKKGNFKDFESILKSILSTNPNLVEFRFDYVDDIENITPDFLENILNLTKPNVLSIFTFRDKSEGGQYEQILPREGYLNVINILIEAQPEYIDIEMNSDLHILGEIIKKASDNDVKLIFSYHDFEKTPIYEEIQHILERFKDKLLNNHLIDFLTFKQVIFKMIFTAQKLEDNLIPLKLCEKFSEREKEQGIISFCMGENGIFSRITCVKFGSFLTFASFEDATAPGQIKIEAMRELHKQLFNQ